MLHYNLIFLLFLSAALLPAQNRVAFEADAGKAYELLQAGKVDEAKPITDRLLQQATSLADAQALTDIGIAFEEKGRYSEAEPFHKRALEINQRQDGENHPDTARSLTNLAINYKERGRYAEAEPLYKQALDIVAPNGLHAALLMNNLAFLDQEQYRYAEAEELYLKALDLHKARTGGKDDEYMASPLQNLARLYYFQSREAEPLEKQKLLEKAESFAKRALRIDEQSDPDHPETGASLNMLGAIYSDQNRFNEAEPLLKRALVIYEKGLSRNHPWTAECMHDLATLYERQQRYDEAEPLRNHTIDVYRQSGAEPHLGQDWYKNRAALYKNTNRPKEAVADLKEAMDLSLDVRKHASGSDEQRAHTFSRYYNLFETMVDWQYELGDRNEAYEAMERSRAQGLQDLANASGIDLLAGVPDEFARKLRADEAAAQTEVATAEKMNKYEVLKIARKKLADAKAAIRSMSPAYRLMIAEDRKPVPLDSVRKELVAEKTLALEYLLGGEKSYLLVYGIDTEPRLLPLELDEKQAELYAVESGSLTAKKLETILQNEKENGALQSIADRKKAGSGGVLDPKTMSKLAVLWTLLVPDEDIRTKILDDKTCERLLILPDGTLARFPFESLVVEPNAVNPYYLLDYGPATVYAPSASMYYNLKRAASSSGSPRLLSVGNPVYPPVSPHERPWAPGDGRIMQVPLEPLEGAAAEIRRVADACKSRGFAVTVLDGPQATEANVRKLLPGQKIVHFSCHGAMMEEGNRSLGFLALTVGNPNEPKNDGYLELAEMFELEMKSCELVVISACETNLGQAIVGEGVWSMGHGMMASGARRVVTTNWEVTDDASTDLVSDFIGEISESSLPDHATALRNAKRMIRGNPDNPQWRHPYYWAPFVLIGPH